VSSVYAKEVALVNRLFNNVKTAFLLGALMAIFIAVGSAWGQQGMIMGLLFGGVANIVAFFFSDKITLKAMQAQEIHADSPAPARGLYQMVDELRQRAGLPMPRVYICPQEAPNAFATGRSPSRAAVAVTVGALRLLNERELRGVMAHELAHVKNRDTLISCIAATVSGVLAFIAQWGMLLGGGNNREGGNPLFAILAVILGAVGAAVIKAMISRSREYVADHDGAVIAGEPDGLISALQKLHVYNARIPMANANPAQNNLFIVEPMMGTSLLRLFATHPPVENRIAALREVRVA
jgi:heat shock protein HtpX